MHTYDIVQSGSQLKDAGHALILLHGRGGSPHDMIALANRFVDGDWCLLAPGAVNGTWYPNSFMRSRESNEPWLGSAVDIVYRLLAEVNAHIPYDHIHVMGFSQGACLATEITARKPRQYGGIYAFTGGLIGEQIDTREYRGSFEGSPVYLSNSDDDPHVPLERSKQTMAVFERLNAKVTLDVFPGRQHTIDPHEIERVREMMGATA